MFVFWADGVKSCWADIDRTLGLTIVLYGLNTVVFLAIFQQRTNSNIQTGLEGFDKMG
jgi:hypothetical protein